MSALDDIIDLIRDKAGADFAFILSRRGRLVTRHAPENMPEEGRLGLVSAAEPLLGSDRVALRTMPREAIVPYGGAAPVDVYIGAREAAIVCVVMATWSDQSQVMGAFEMGFTELDRLIGDELAKRGRTEVGKRRKTMAPIPPAPGSSSGRAASRKPPPAAPSSSAGQRSKTSVPPARANRRTILGVDDPSAEGAREVAPLPKVPVPKAPGSSSGRGRGRTQRPPPFSMPSAQKSRTQRPPAPAAVATLPKDFGRGTLPFIPGDNSPTQQALRAIAAAPRAPGPDITIGEARIGHATLVAIELEASAPQISFGAAPLGRETLAAIDASVVPQGSSSGAAPELRVTLASMPDLDPDELEPLDRHTLPFTESAADAKKAYEDAAKLRAAEPPDVRVRLASLDFETKSAVLEEKSGELAEAARRARAKAMSESKRNSNIDAWHDALNELVGDDGKSGRKKPRPK